MNRLLEAAMPLSYRWPAREMRGVSWHDTQPMGRDFTGPPGVAARRHEAITSAGFDEDIYGIAAEARTSRLI